MKSTFAAASLSALILLTIVVSMFFAFTPRAEAVGLAADAQCIPVIPQCGCGQIMGAHGCVGANNRYLCPCIDTTNGFTTSGTCQADQKCHATGTSGPNGFGTDILKQMLGSLFQKLMQGGQGGSGSGSGATSPTSNCTSYTQTSDQTLASTNPCYYYVPSVSSSLGGTTDTSGVNTNNVSDLLNQALGGSGNTTTDTSSSSSTTNTNNNNSSNSNTNTVTVTASTTASSTPQQIFSTTQATTAFLTPGVTGDIKLLTSGGTILAGNVDTGGNSAVAGFYGSDTFNGQPQGVVAQLCQNRPWANNFLSYVIPASFFDSLCSLRGYTVGKPQPVQTSTVTVTQSAPKPLPTTTSTSTVSTVPPKVDIWASPATVRLGARTSIFWTSQGVTKCTETSPDGNFSQNSLQGGASTAPITDATVFTISCLALDGSPVTDNVTVNLSI